MHDFHKEKILSPFLKFSATCLKAVAFEPFCKKIIFPPVILGLSAPKFCLDNPLYDSRYDKEDEQHNKHQGTYNIPNHFYLSYISHIFLVFDKTNLAVDTLRQWCIIWAMKEEAFNELLESVRQAGKISRGEMPPSREFHVEPVDVERILSPASVTV